MKKIIALMLVLCMMLFAIPAFAESTGSSGLGDLLGGLLGGSDSGEGQSGGLGDLLGGLLGGSEGGKGEEGGLGSLLSGLVDKLGEEGKEGVSKLGAVLKEKLEKELANPDSKIGELLNSLAQGGSADLDALLGSLLGGGETAEGTGEDDETIAETLERMNREAEAETGDSVPGKKNAESVEEFYGQWKDSKFTLLGEEYDMSDSDEGVFIGENTYYVTVGGEKSPDYQYPETAELTIRDGILKINSDGHWTNFVMTENGEIVQPGESLSIYLVRAE